MPPPPGPDRVKNIINLFMAPIARRNRDVWICRVAWSRNGLQKIGFWDIENGVYDFHFSMTLIVLYFV